MIGVLLQVSLLSSMALHADRSEVAVALTVCCMSASAWIDTIGDSVAVECIDRTPTSS